MNRDLAFRYIDAVPEVAAAVVAYLIVLAAARYIVRQRYANDLKSHKWFMRGLHVKVLGSILIGLLYYNFYGGGDGFEFFFAARKIRHVFLENPIDAINFWNFDWEGRPPREYPQTSDAQLFTSYGIGLPHYLDDPATFRVVQLITPFCLITFGNFYAASILLSFFAFLGLWGFYRTLTKSLKHVPQSLPLFIFYVPSVAVWTSGIQKETFTLMFLLFIYYLQYHLNFRRTPRALLYLTLILYFGYQVYTIKSYTILAFGPVLFFLFLGDRVSSTKSRLVRILFHPSVTLLIFLIAGYFAISQEGNDFSLQKNLEQAQIKQSDLTKDYYYKEKGGGSVYILPAYDPTPQGFLSIVPYAIVISFFRPFLWEANNFLVMFTALESFLITLVVLYALLRTGFFGLFFLIFRDNTLSLFLLGSLIFGVFCALASGNFGNLARYKIPAMPFFLVAINLIIFYTTQRYKELKAKQTEAMLLRSKGINTRIA